MTTGAFINVWSITEATDRERLTLLALADCATPKGYATVSIRELCDAAGLTRTVLCKALDNLLTREEIELIQKGGGKNTPNRYRLAEQYWSTPARLVEKVEVERLAPAPEAKAPELAIEVPSMPLPVLESTKFMPVSEPTPAIAPVVEDITVTDVLMAAGVVPPDDQPFFWLRVDHQVDLENYLSAQRISASELCVRLKAAANKGRKPPSTARSVRAVLTMLDTET